MRVLLVTPAYPRASERWMPLGICYIAAALLGKGHEVKIFDRYVSGVKNENKDLNKMMLEEIRGFAPEIIGFNTITPVIYDTMEAVKLVRGVYSKPIVLGGHHATAFPELTLERIPEADALIAGEGERSFGMLAGNALKETIPGLYWREGGGSGGQNRGVVDDLDQLPLPAYHLLDLDYYTKPNLATIRPFFLRVGSVLASRGCKNRCAYCTESLTYSGGIRYHSAGYVAENVELMVRKYHCNGVTFLDNDFLAERDQAVAILEELIFKKLNGQIRFCIQSRVTNIDKEIARLLKEAGCIKVELGLETNNEELLGKINKNAKVFEAESAVKICRDYGISVQANLMMGFEGETIEMLDHTLNWVTKLRVDNIKWGMLKIFPGSRLYSDQENRFFEDNEWTRENINSFYDTDQLSKISPLDREKWLNKRLKPYRRFLHHRGIWKYNSVSQCFKHYYEAFLLRGVKMRVV